MRTIQFRRQQILFTASALAFGVAALQPAFAQDGQANAPAAPAGETQATEEIIVNGTRESLASAIERKKKAGTVADSIVAEDISQFPDKNVGEALQRVTGVQLSRDGGEGSQVSIRGVEPDLNRVEINGVTLLGQNFDTINPGSKTVDFREVASELVKSIDVFKGFTADMTEGGVGGTVSISTRKPLELKKPLLSLTASAQQLDTEGKWRPRANLTAGTKLLDNRLGVLVNFTYDNSFTRTDLIRNTDWIRFTPSATTTAAATIASGVDINNDNVKITTNPLYANITTPAGCLAVAAGDARTACYTQFAEFVPRIPRFSIQERNDKRISGMATVQYQVTDNLDFYVEYQRNRRDNHYRDFHSQLEIAAIARISQNAAGACVAPTAGAPGCVVDADGNLIDFWTAPTALTGNAGAAGIYQADQRDFKLTQDSNYKSAGFNWNNDRIRVAGLAVLSEAKTVSDSRLLRLSGIIPSIHVQLDPTNGNPTLTFPAADDPNDPDTFINPSIAVPAGTRRITYQWRPEELDVSEDQFKLDADFETGNSFLKSIEVGGQYRRTTYLRYSGSTDPGLNRDGIFVHTPGQTVEVSVGNAAVPWVPPQPGAASTRAQTWTQATLSNFILGNTEMTPGTFFDRATSGTYPTGWLVPRFDGLANYFDTSFSNHDLVRQDCLTRNASGQPICAAQPPSHDVEEDIWAGYLKGNFEFELAGIPFSGNIGMRYAHTRDVASGIFRRGGNTAPFELISIEKKYGDWLPSFNLMFGLIPDKLIARIGAAKVLARPRPQDLSPNLVCNVGLDGSDLTTCSGGNPALEPYRANQYDLNIAYYMNRDTLLSAAFFYKDIKSYVVTDVLQTSVDYFGNGDTVDIRQPINARGAKIKGVELSVQTAFTFLPAPLDGFGVQANYTYADADNVGLVNELTQEALSFPGLSKHSWNVIAYYDKDWLNARVAYNARSSYLRSPRERSGNPAYADATGYLDAKVTVRLKDLPGSPSFFVEGKNLTKEVERTTAGSIRLQDLAYAGRRFFVGAAMKF